VTVLNYVSGFATGFSPIAYYYLRENLISCLKKYIIVNIFLSGVIAFCYPRPIIDSRFLGFFIKLVSICFIVWGVSDNKTYIVILVCITFMKTLSQLKLARFLEENIAQLLRTDHSQFSDEKCSDFFEEINSQNESQNNKLYNKNKNSIRKFISNEEYRIQTSNFTEKKLYEMKCFFENSSDNSEILNKLSQLSQQRSVTYITFNFTFLHLTFLSLIFYFFRFVKFVKDAGHITSQEKESHNAMTCGNFIWSYFKKK